MINCGDNMKKIDIYKCCILKKEESNLPYDLALATQIKNRKPFLYICLERFGKTEYLTITIDRTNPRVYRRIPLYVDEIYYIDDVKEYIKVYSNVLLKHYYEKLSDKTTLNKLYNYSLSIREYNRVIEK